MKIPDKLEVIVVNFINGTQETFTPTSKVEEFEDCYEFKESVEGKTKMNVIMRSQIKNAIFVEK